MTHTSSSLMHALVGLATFASVGSVHPQGVYRSVEADGKVTFSDRAAAPESASLLQERAAAPASRGTSLAALPLALRQTASRFPIILYTSSGCASCASARNLLKARGVPFSEFTVQSNEDIEALERLSGNAALPFATIGNQQLSGFSDQEWTQYLDAAGYPKQSWLPSNYQNPAPAPLVAIKRAEARQTPDVEKKPEAATELSRTLPAHSKPASSNPAGIRF